MVEEMERVYTIPLRKAKSIPRTRRAKRAMKEVKEFLSKHLKAGEIWIDPSINEAIWSRGMRNIPSRIRVKAVETEDGVIEASIPGKKKMERLEKIEEEEIEEERREEEKEVEEELEEKKEIEKEEVEEIEGREEKESELSQIPGIGTKMAEKLEEAGITAEDISEMTAEELQEIDGIGPKTAKRIKEELGGEKEKEN